MPGGLLPSYFFPLSFAAFTNPTNNGCGFIGRDKNSGWNWLATMYGWSVGMTKKTSGQLPGGL
jgi:hypothetical protein